MPEIEENETEETENFENSDDHADDFVKTNAKFPEKDDDDQAQDAVILKETPREMQKSENEEDDETEIADDKFSLLFKNLPPNSKTKFLIDRLPDEDLAGEFRIPCNVESKCEPIYWRGENETSAVHQRIANRDGGGFYRIRTHNSKGFVKGGTWTVVIADPAEMSEKEKTIVELAEAKRKEHDRKEPVSPPFANQNQSSEKPKDALDLLAERLDHDDRLNNLLDRLRPQQQSPPSQPSARETRREKILDKALGNAELVKLATYAELGIAPPEEKETGFFAFIGHKFMNDDAWQNTALDYLQSGVELVRAGVDFLRSSKDSKPEQTTGSPSTPITQDSPPKKSISDLRTRPRRTQEPTGNETPSNGQQITLKPVIPLIKMD